MSILGSVFVFLQEVHPAIFVLQDVQNWWQIDGTIIGRTRCACVFPELFSDFLRGPCSSSFDEKKHVVDSRKEVICKSIGHGVNSRRNMSCK